MHQQTQNDVVFERAVTRKVIHDWERDLYPSELLSKSSSIISKGLFFISF
jgi:hypothetical protein